MTSTSRHWNFGGINLMYAHMAQAAQDHTSNKRALYINKIPEMFTFMVLYYVFRPNKIIKLLFNFTHNIF